MLDRLRRLFLSTTLALGSITGLAMAVPLVAHASGPACPVSIWSGPYITTDETTHRARVQALVQANCSAQGRGGDLLRFQIRRGTVVVADGTVTCAPGCDYHHIVAVDQTAYCTSSVSTTYTPRIQTLIDDKFGWSDWSYGPAKTLPCFV
jgi:hypothetical protein